jgi:hypothetical protein
MLASRARSFSLSIDGVSAADSSGKARRVAIYTLSATGNTVVNDIHASFTLKDGKIATHADSLKLRLWTASSHLSILRSQNALSLHRNPRRVSTECKQV